MIHIKPNFVGIFNMQMPKKILLIFLCNKISNFFIFSFLWNEYGLGLGLFKNL
jgi:hypothetical protein